MVFCYYYQQCLLLLANCTSFVHLLFYFIVAASAFACLYFQFLYKNKMHTHFFCFSHFKCDFPYTDCTIFMLRHRKNFCQYSDEPIAMLWLCRPNASCFIKFHSRKHWTHPHRYMTNRFCSFTPFTTECIQSSDMR